MDHHDSEPQTRPRRHRRPRRPSPRNGAEGEHGEDGTAKRPPSPTPATSRTVASGLIKIDVTHEPTVLAALARIATAHALAGKGKGGCSLSFFSGDRTEGPIWGGAQNHVVATARFDNDTARTKSTATSLPVTIAMPMNYADVTPLPDVPGVGETWLRHWLGVRGVSEVGFTYVVARAGRPGAAKRLVKWIARLRLSELERIRSRRMVVITGSRRDVRAPELDVLIHPPSIDLAGLVSSLREFRSPATAQRYERTGRPWRIVVLLTGPPGCGKTASILAVCAELGITEVFIPARGGGGMFGPASPADQLGAMPHGCTVVIEDVERCEKDDTQAVAAALCTSSEASRSRDAKVLADVGSASSRLLNALDGAMAPSGGAIIFLTSNHPQTLRGALLRRTDIVLTFDWASDDQVARLVAMWFTDGKPKDPVEHRRRGKKKATDGETPPSPELADDLKPEPQSAPVDVRAVAQQFAAELRQHIGTIPLSMAALSAHLARTRRAGSTVVTDLLGSGPYSAQSLARDIKEQEELATIGSAKWTPDPALQATTGSFPYLYS